MATENGFIFRYTHLNRAYVLCIFVSVFFFTRCAGSGTIGDLLSGNSAVRTVHVKVVVDSSYITNAKWEVNIRGLIDAASTYYRSWNNVQFAIDTIYPVDFATNPGYSGYYANDYIVTKIPKGTSEMVIYFSKITDDAKYYLAGVSYYAIGYLFVNQMGWYGSEKKVLQEFVDKDPYKWAFIILIHELGHMFGAIHIYPQEDTSFLMEPMLDEGDAERSGKGYDFSDPVFDRGNADIIYTLAGRPFRESEWKKEHWPAILAVYNRSCPRLIRKNSYGLYEIIDHPVYEIFDKYLTLASFASLCGLDSTAVTYADSLSIISDIISQSNLPPDNLIVERCEHRFGSEWKTTLRMLTFLERAIIFIRTGETARVDEELYKLMELVKDKEYFNLNKTIAFLNWLRQYYRR